MPGNKLPVDRKNLDLLYRHVFDDPKNGLPDNINKNGCLALAQLGVASWNAWRRDFPTLGGKYSFGYGTRSEYANFADFRNHVFEEQVDFSNFNFGMHADFENAEFKKQANFGRSTFGEDANFDLVKFQSDTRFQNSRFEDGVCFKCARFINLAFFSYAQFGGKVDFTGASFHGQTNFDKVVFGRELVFDQSNFDCSVINFMGTSWNDFLSVYSPDEIEDIKLWATKRDLRPGKISGASFCGAKFKGRVDFSGNEFFGKTRFSSTTVDGVISWHEKDESGFIKSPAGKAKELASFKQEPGRHLVFGAPPVFHDCKFNQDISFDGAEFPAATGLESSSRAYRTLKLAFVQMQAVREEQRFFRLEMAEEHHSVKEPIRWMHAVYAFLSDYGFSVRKPFLFFLATLLFAWIGYGFLAGYSLCIPSLSNCRPSRERFEFGLANAFPLPGLDGYAERIRPSLFPSHLHPIKQILVMSIIIVQKAFSLLAFFLMGLALRNLFKMK